MSSKKNIAGKGAKAAPKSVLGKRRGLEEAAKSAVSEVAVPEATEVAVHSEAVPANATPEATAESTPTTAPETQQVSNARPAKPARESWKGKSVEELRALFRETLGRDTQSESRAYIAWAVTQARKGKKRIGPPREKREAGTLQVIPLTLPRTTVAALDAAWGRIGLRSRTECIRRALQAYLGGQGEDEVAGLVAAEA